MLSLPRCSGILLHPTSLPGRFGIGEIGRGAELWLETLHRMGQRAWQVLPLGPTGYGNSPYQSLSSFAGNPLLISLDSLVRDARGLVCVNSTSATLALAHGTPVCTIGEAIYDIPGLTHQHHLDDFWSNPTPPDAGLYPAFRRVLVDRCLVRGGLASESAVTELIGSILKRLGYD